MLVHTVILAAAQKLGIDSKTLRAFYNGERIKPTDTFVSRGMENGHEVDIYPERLGGKPVIYLYSPLDIDVSVTLSLTPEWRFSALYPLVPMTRIGEEHIQWNIRTHQDGSLTEKNTGLDVSYLFWEAEYVCSMSVCMDVIF
jgi:hypothetical protein